jgi:membrane-associated phospholipid phosphatase
MNTAGLLSVGEARSWGAVYQWGLALVRAVQTIENPVLTALVKGLTALGSEGFYVPVILLVYWCMDEKKGRRLALLLILSAWANSGLKVLLQQPRPYFLDPSVGLSAASGFGLPSGHAQQSLLFWVAALSGSLKKQWVWLIAGAVTLVMGFTRLYLGLHFPTDLLGGWVLALAILGGYYFLWPFVEGRLAAGGMRTELIAAAMVTFGMNALYPEDRQFGALFLGFCVGYQLTGKYFPFSAAAAVPGAFSGPLLRGARFLLGAAGGALVYLGGKLLLGEDHSLLSRLPVFGTGYYELGRFLRYSLLGLWASAGAPWLFLRLRLAR